MSTAQTDGLTSSNNFFDAVNGFNTAGGRCYVGWLQRGAVIPDETPGVWSDPANTQKVGLIVGASTTFQISVPYKVGTSSWFNMNVGGDFFSIDILAIEDPGLPLNMSLTPTTFGGPGCGYSFCRTAQWTPIPGQEDRTWQAHFVATSQCCANGECLSPSSSNIVSVFIVVSGPVSVWSQDTLNQVKDWALTVGESQSVSLQCTTFQGVPAINIVNISRNGAAAPDSQGLNLALFQSTAAAVTCAAGSLSDPLRCTATAVATVTADPGDEGSVKQWCFSCGDAAGIRGAAQPQCLTVTTNLCEYQVARAARAAPACAADGARRGVPRAQVQAGDTLRAVSRRQVPRAHPPSAAAAAAARPPALPPPPLEPRARVPGWAGSAATAAALFRSALLVRALGSLCSGRGGGTDK